MDAACLLANDAGPEADLRAKDALASDVDVDAIRKSELSEVSFLSASKSKATYASSQCSRGQISRPEDVVSVLVEGDES